VLAEVGQQWRRAHVGDVPALQAAHLQDVPGLYIAKPDIVLRVGKAAWHPDRDKNNTGTALRIN